MSMALASSESTSSADCNMNVLDTLEPAEDHELYGDREPILPRIMTLGMPGQPNWKHFDLLLSHICYPTPLPYVSQLSP